MTGIGAIAIQEAEMVVASVDRVKTAMSEARARQSELARAVGMSPSHVCLILRGARMPSLPVAKKIADHLGITLDELYGEVVAAN